MTTHPEAMRAAIAIVTAQEMAQGQPEDQRAVLIAAADDEMAFLVEAGPVATIGVFVELMHYALHLAGLAHNRGPQRAWQIVAKSALGRHPDPATPSGDTVV